MFKKRVLRLILPVLLATSLCVGIAACAGLHRQPSTDPTAATAPVTPLERANFDNLQIAAHNRAAAQAIIAAHNAGFIETEYFDKLTAGQIQITQLHAQLTPLLKTATSANSAQISLLLAQIRDIAKGMVVSGSAGVKDASSKAMITDDIASISSLADSVLALLSTAGVIKP